VVLLGGGRTGRAIISYLNNHKIPFVVLDFNPAVFTSLTAEGVPVLFGDISDPDIYEMSAVKKSKLVISTTNNMMDNLFLLEAVRRKSSRPTTIFTTAERSDGIKLYEKGADYVLVPHRIAGEHIRHILSTYGTSDERIKKLGKANFNRLMSK
ncbi:NAD-binding protein, partial [Candidatus Woesebacteria bacterium]|nr:NAD-binding protein [Candidatus Woesebacteria bacterium]